VTTVSRCHRECRRDTSFAGWKECECALLTDRKNSFLFDHSSESSKVGERESEADVEANSSDMGNRA
jgi:hypothetical protein